MRASSIANATIIEAPSSTKNASGERAPEMHQAKKGNQWHFGIKAHLAVDAESGIVHSLICTAANINDVMQGRLLLPGEEMDAFGDAGYRGVKKCKEARGPKWHIAMRPGNRRLLTDSALGQMIEATEKIKASIRAKMEHPFHVVKICLSTRRPATGLWQKKAQLFSLFGLANLMIARRPLLAMQGRGAA